MCNVSHERCGAFEEGNSTCVMLVMSEVVYLQRGNIRYVMNDCDVVIGCRQRVSDEQGGKG